MSERPKFCGFNITRSIQDRIFLGVIGFILMVPTGFVLCLHQTAVSWRELSLGARVLLVCIDEGVLTVFLLGICCFIWGIAAPQWIERFFTKIISKFLMVLGVISLVLIGLAIYFLSVGI